MRFDYEIKRARVNSGEVKEWVNDIVSGQYLELYDILEMFRYEAEETIEDELEQHGVFYSTDDIQEIIEEDWEEVAEIIAENLIDEIIDELETINDSVITALDNLQS